MEGGREADQQAAILSPLIGAKISIYNMIKLNMKTFLYLWRNVYKES